MASQPFDPNGAVRFDLRSGSASDSRGARLVLVPSSAFEFLDADALAQIGEKIGRACGARIAAHLGGDRAVRESDIETVITHLAGELAIAGVGSVHIERWGRALVAIVSNPSVSGDAFIGAVVAGAFSAATGRDVYAAPLGRERGESRYFLGSSGTAERVRSLVGQGKGYAEIVATIQGGAS
jgi:hypothetical protein